MDEPTNVLLETISVPEEKMAPPLSVDEKPEMVTPWVWMRAVAVPVGEEGEDDGVRCAPAHHSSACTLRS